MNGARQKLTWLDILMSTIARNTNKSGSLLRTNNAARQYMRKIRIDIHISVPIYVHTQGTIREHPQQVLI